MKVLAAMRMGALGATLELGSMVRGRLYRGTSEAAKVGRTATYYPAGYPAGITTYYKDGMEDVLQGFLKLYQFNVDSRSKDIVITLFECSAPRTWLRFRLMRESRIVPHVE